MEMMLIKWMHYKENKANEQKWGMNDLFFVKIRESFCYVGELSLVSNVLELFVKIFSRYKKITVGSKFSGEIPTPGIPEPEVPLSSPGELRLPFADAAHHRYHLRPRCSCHSFRHHRILHCHYASLACTPKRWKCYLQIMHRKTFIWHPQGTLTLRWFEKKLWQN